MSSSALLRLIPISRGPASDCQQLYSFKGQYNLTLDELRTAYEKDPQTPVTYKALVVGLIRMKKLEEPSRSCKRW